MANIVSKNFLERLQAADNRTKTRWTFFATAVIMAGVMFVWLGYFNSLIGTPAAETSPVFQEETLSHDLTFFETTGHGAVILYQGLLEKLKSIGSIFGGPKELIITPSQ